MYRVSRGRQANQSLRIGFYTPNYPGVAGEGGIGTYVRNISHALGEAGHEIHVLVPGAERELVEDGVRLHLVSAPHLPGVDRFLPGAGAVLHIGRAMRSLVRRHNLDVVEFPNWEGLALGFAFPRPVPLVVRLHTSTLETIRIDGVPATWVRRMDAWRERATVLAADTIVTHSKAHQATMAKELGISPARIRIVPHGIQPVDDTVAPERDPHTVVYLGRLERRKGTLDLLHAARIVLRTMPSARFVLIGADRPHCPGGRTHAEYLQQEFSDGERDRISLLGRLPDDEVESWLRRATVFAAPSLYESFGLIFLEAMRWGTPVVGARAGGVPEIVEDGSSGLLVPPEDPEALAQAILGLLEDPTRRRKLGIAGRERARSVFSIQAVAQQAVALYSHTIEHRGASGLETR